MVQHFLNWTKSKYQVYFVLVIKDIAEVSEE